MNKTRQVTLSFNNGQYVIDLYVTPENIRITRPHNTRKFIGINGEEVNLSAGHGLQRVTLQAMLPQSAIYGNVVGSFQTPAVIIEMLKKWQDSRLPMRLVISGTSINEAFLIEDLTQSFVEGDRDIYLTLSLCQYRFVKAELVPGNQPSIARGENQVAIPQSHTVVQGDTLWAISKTYFGTPNKWHELQEKNDIADVRKLQIGQVIRL